MMTKLAAVLTGMVLLVTVCIGAQADNEVYKPSKETLRMRAILERLGVESREAALGGAARSTDTNTVIGHLVVVQLRAQVPLKIKTEPVIMEDMLTTLLRAYGCQSAVTRRLSYYF